MSTASRRTGTAFESALVAHIREHYGLEAERLRQAGKNDQGDIAVRDVGLIYLIEAKAEKSIGLSGYVIESETERGNYCHARRIPESGVMPLAVVKRRGMSIGKAYAITTLDEFFGRD